MPSVFNHENSCWGVKRSLCNVFQNDLHEEVQDRKLPEASNNTNSCSLPAGNNPIQYSVSSNGYYGYQPHTVVGEQFIDKSDITVCDYSEDNAMEVEDCSNRPPSATFGSQFTINCNIINASRFQNCKRKRHMPNSAEEASKRMRQNDLGAVESGLPTHVHHRKEYFTHPKCVMSHFM